MTAVIVVVSSACLWAWKLNRRPDTVSGDWLTHHYKETGRRL